MSLHIASKSGPRSHTRGKDNQRIGLDFYGLAAVAHRNSNHFERQYTSSLLAMDPFAVLGLLPNNPYLMQAVA